MTGVILNKINLFILLMILSLSGFFRIPIQKWIIRFISGSCPPPSGFTHPRHPLRSDTHYVSRLTAKSFWRFR